MANSENANELVGLLIEKYGLDKEIEEELVKKKLEGAENFLQKEGIKLLFSKSLEEQLEKGGSLDEVLASRKLRKIIAALNKNKFSTEKLTVALQEIFNLSQKDAEWLGKDLQENLTLLSAEIPDHKEVVEEEVVLEVQLPEKKDLQPKGKDIYKEKIE